MLRKKHLFLSVLGAAVASTLGHSAAPARAAEGATPVLGADIMAPATDAELEQKIEALKPTAPRLTKELIQAVIVDGTNTTVCRLQLANGFCVVGINNGPVSAANFDQNIGCEYAYKAAVDQVWPLEGYLLAERLHQLAQAPAEATHVANPGHVTARRIAQVNPVGGPAGSNCAELVFSDGTSYTASLEMCARYWPLAGDYLVRAEDGYEYLNPADVFERKYSAVR